MEATIVNFRKGKHTQRNNYMVVMARGVNTRKKAEELKGKNVVWESPAKKEIKGKVQAAHGNKGCVRVLFEKGMPGQAVGSRVRVE